MDQDKTNEQLREENKQLKNELKKAIEILKRELGLDVINFDQILQ